MERRNIRHGQSSMLLKGSVGTMPTGGTSPLPSPCGPPRGRLCPTSVKLSASGLRSDSTSGGKREAWLLRTTEVLPSGHPHIAEAS